MKDESLFISDLHLSHERPEVTQRFLNFLTQRAPRSRNLYILGDLFDSWIGDDNPAQPNPVIISALRSLSDKGTKIYFQGGNRDFLIGKDFCNETGIILLDDYTVIDLYGTPTLLMHGDLLCSDDKAYLAYREKTHDPEWLQKALKLPLFLRRALVRWIKIRSYFQKKNKNSQIMDVNTETVLRTMRNHSVLCLIHGHTHRHAIHDFTLDNKAAQRLVLEEWDHGGSLLCWNPEGYTFEAV
ncbi:MAG: UDP-2,3-diacylglucosamine diphosphatase [Gammaproteobacteria bacterium]|nr:MAG: UDP-2,3-diacylglucosamine diphosphatase [Gammaproteobacteria bacterium]